MSRTRRYSVAAALAVASCGGRTDGAVARSVPLNSPRGLVEINRWADSATAGKIRRLVDAPVADPSVFVTNAVYFKGAWLKPFDKTATRERDSRSPPGAVSASR